MQRTYRELYKPKAKAYWTSTAAPLPRGRAAAHDVPTYADALPQALRVDAALASAIAAEVGPDPARHSPPPRVTAAAAEIFDPMAAPLAFHRQFKERVGALRDVVDQEPTPSRRLVQPRFGAPEEPAPPPADEEPPEAEDGEGGGEEGESAPPPPTSPMAVEPAVAILTEADHAGIDACLLYTSPSPRD